MTHLEGRLAVLCALVLIAGCGTTIQSSPPPDPEAAAASARFRQGLELRAQNNHEKALAHLEEARAIRWSPRVDIEIARTLDTLKRGSLACRYWLSLDDAPELKDVAQRKEVGGRSAECWKDGLGVPWPTAGPRDAPVTIVEFSDFQCPFCSRVQPTMRRVFEEFPGQVRLVFMHNPLAFHKEAKPAALAALAAHRQGRFWELHDILFDRQKNLGHLSWPAIAEEVGLDAERFDRDRDDPGSVAHVERQMAIAAFLGARGTPTFFINGKKFAGAQPFEKFAGEIRAQVDEAKALERKGTPRDQLHEVLSEPRNPRYAALILRGEDPPPAEAPVERPNPQGQASSTVWKVPLRGDEPSRGPADALVTIVEFSDFQCPFCVRVQPTLQGLLEKYGRDLRIVFKHNPLPFHRQAMPAHQASLAAHAQGRFWPMHDKLFENIRGLTRANFDTWAHEIGLDTAAFGEALETGLPAIDATIKADRELAESVEARGTPTFFINGRSLRGAMPAAAFESVIDEELARARGLVGEGTPREKVYETVTSKGKQIAPLEERVHELTIQGRPGFGPKEAPVTVAVFHDYQCPYCKRLEPKLRALLERMPGKVRVVFKQMPLSFHQQAMNAAKAAVAAHLQGKFEPMHAALYEKPRELKDGVYPRLARKVRLEARRFRRDFASKAVAELIAVDKAEAERAGIRGTPTITINGRIYKGQSREPAALARVIRRYVLKWQPSSQR